MALLRYPGKSVMADLRVANAMRDSPPLSPTDSVGKAMLLLRRLSLPALVVVWEGRPIGIFSELALLMPTAHSFAEIPPEAFRSLSVAQVMSPISITAQENMPLPEAAELLRSHSLSCLPVVDEDGFYRGLLCRQDAVAALCNIVSPGPLAGMATPLGVYLTNGAVRAGAGDAGLFLTGAFLAFLWFLSAALVGGICWAVQGFTSLPLLALRDAIATYPGELYFGHSGLWTALFFLGQLAGFFLLMRLLPLAGTHGAEHQVVHAIESGEELSPQKVLSNTTVHPRCGTNLAAMMLVIGGGIYYFTRVRAAEPFSLVLYVSLVAIMAILLRQRLGGLLQRLITTRRPSERQLQAALRVGGQLLERCRRQRSERRPTPLKRLWNLGLVQVLAGAAFTSYLVGIVQDWLGTRFLL